MDASTTGKGHTKGGKRNKSKGTTPLRQTPARTTATIIKKPAAAPPTAKVLRLANKINMTDVFAKLRKLRMESTTNRNCFTSMAYHHGRKRAMELGATIDDSKAVGSTQYQKASKLWDETK